MGQPVVDTLQLSDALRRTGMDRDQAEGIARTLGSELGRHIPARGDLEAFRSGVDSQLEAFRSDIDAQLAALRSDVDAQFKLSRSEVDARFRALDTKFNILTTGVALTLAFLAVLTGLNLFPRASAELAATPAPVAPSPVTVYFAPDGWSSVPPAAPEAALAVGD